MYCMIGNMRNDGMVESFCNSAGFHQSQFFAELWFRFTINDKQKNWAIIQLIFFISTIPLSRDITS